MSFQTSNSVHQKLQVDGVALLAVLVRGAQANLSTGQLDAGLASRARERPAVIRIAAAARVVCTRTAVAQQDGLGQGQLAARQLSGRDRAVTHVRRVQRRYVSDGLGLGESFHRALAERRQTVRVRYRSSRTRQDQLVVVHASVRRRRRILHVSIRRKRRVGRSRR